MNIKKTAIRTRIILSAVVLSFISFLPIINKSYTLFLNSEQTILFISLSSYFLLSIIFIFWITGFKVSEKGVLLLFCYPFISLIPLLIFILNFDFNEINSQYVKELILLCFFLITLFFNYLFLLVVNILNGAASMFLPLAQAAKSAQFIFALVSVYIFIFFFYTNITNIFGFAVFFLVIFVFFNLYLSIFFIHEFNYTNLTVGQKIENLNNIPLLKRFNNFLISSFDGYSFIEALVGSLIMLVAFVGLAIWPIDIIYKTLSISLIFYLVFNSILEGKLNKTKRIWREYVFIILVIFVALFLNSFWGVNGSILI